MMEFCNAKVIEVIIKNRWNDNKKDFQIINWNLAKIAEVLATHDLETLKKLFYVLLHMNVPADMLTDRGYVKVNLCHVLAYYVNEIMNHEIIRIEDKFDKCKFCEQYYYFDSYKNDTCEPCYVKYFPEHIAERRRKLRQW